MTTEERISGSLQESLLTLLCFDDKHCKIARGAVSANLFESAMFRDVAERAIDFIDQFGKPIGEHVADELEGILDGDDKRKATAYKHLLENLYAARTAINGEYVVSQLHKFVRQQNLKSAVIKAIESIEDGKIDQAELELEKGLRSVAPTFSPGLNLSDAAQVLAAMESNDTPGIELGIKPLDDRGIIPRRKQLFAFLAAKGRGKSWFCTHVAKWALLQRWSVLIVTLEMSEGLYAQRLLQSFFSISKRDADVRVTQFKRDRQGDFTGVIHEEIERRTMRDADITSHVAGKIKREFRKRPPLIIKEFPTRSLTIAGLRAYLDNLERFHKITPDLIILDYPGLMQMSANNKRIELGHIYEDLRGIGVERNAAIVVPAQANRGAERASTVRGDDTGEDISLLATADVFLTYSQTEAEKKMSLARLFVEKGRNEADDFSVLITQAYAIGQFATDALLMAPNYWQVVHPRKDDEDD